MATYRLLIEYDGGAFHGWQTQPNVPTVQDALEDACAVVLNQPVSVVGSGRTDAGVHARGQVAHVNLPENAPAPFRLRASLNGLTPDSVAIRQVQQVDDRFHSRFDARERRYHYYVGTHPFALDRNSRWHCYPPPDFRGMNLAARSLIGTHNFSAFCIARSTTENRVCEVREARWIKDPHPGYWHFCIRADRFIHGMVRAIVGTLIEIGKGQRASSDLADVLDSEDRRRAGFSAPAHGLVLESVSYVEDEKTGSIA